MDILALTLPVFLRCDASNAAESTAEVSEVDITQLMGDILGSDKWAAGPSLIVGAQPGNWSIFALLDNVWDFAGSGEQEVNAFNLQYQAVYLFPKNWFFITNWNVEADWTEPSNNRWTVPVGASTWRAIAVLDLIF